MSLKRTLITINTLISVIFYGQFAIINDKDGFTNVRENSKIDSKIINKLKNGHLIYLFENQGNWTNIDYSIKGEEIKNGFVYKDRTIPISNYLTIGIKSEKNNSIKLLKDNIEINIYIQPFQKNKHKIKYNKIYKDQIELIDNKQYFGKDGGMPTTEYQKIEIKIGNSKYSLPKIAFQNLYEPTFRTTEANYDEKNKILYLSAMNSDGAGSYEVVWKIENGIYKERFIAYGF